MRSRPLLRAAGPALLAVAAAAACPTARATSIPVDRWSFSEGSGSVASDSGTPGGDAASVSAGWTATGLPPALSGLAALTFDGASQSASLASTIALSAASDWSVSLWYRGTDTYGGFGGHDLVGWTGDLYANLILKGGHAVYMHYDGSWTFNIASTASVADGAWHSIVLVNHGGAVSGGIAHGTGDLYVDGVEEVVGVDSSIQLLMPYSAYNISGFMAGPAAYGLTSGALGDVRIYASALSAAEVTALRGAAGGEDAPGVPEPGALGLGAAAAALGLARRRRRASAGG
ncbi:MAG TPA: LamG-like jellyroll fold domain-containing protein [Planctomycetota bacterium]|nr:LamG-like jellyroll fold domain-containing protein [Planctomycetota bacterium]